MDIWTGNEIPRTPYSKGKSGGFSPLITIRKAYAIAPREPILPTTSTTFATTLIISEISGSFRP